MRAKSFVIATGSSIRPIDAPGVPIATSDDMFELQAPPRRALVIGGGAVGLEFAQWLARLGTRVVLSVRSPLLHAKDAEIGAELVGALSEEMDVRVPSKVGDFAADGGRITATIETTEGSERLEFDLVLNAIGRIPNVDGLNLEAAAVSTSEGRLARDTQQRTNVAHVFAAGDVTGDRLILHEANREGQVAGHNAAVAALGGDPIELDDTIPPCEVIFTDPVFASVGRSRSELERDGVPFLEATKRFPQQGRGIVTGARHGLVRLLAHRDTGQVLGCQILNQRADDPDPHPRHDHDSCRNGRACTGIPVVSPDARRSVHRGPARDRRGAPRVTGEREGSKPKRRRRGGRGRGRNKNRNTRPLARDLEAAKTVAKRRFDIPKLRDEQARAIDAVLEGRHAVVVLPTGYGKSLIYQLPAILTDQPTIVIYL